MNTPVNILVVCEAFSSRASGGRAALALAEGLRHLGGNVQVATFLESENVDPVLKETFSITFLERGSNWRKRFTQIVPPACLIAFQKLLSAFKPAVVHFASFDFDKSRFLFRAASETNAQVILQPFIYSTICAQGYGYRSGAPCTACFNGNFLKSVRLGCLSIAKGQLYVPSRYLLRATVLQYADWYISTSVDMDERLAEYGVSRSRIVRLPLPFHPGKLSQGGTVDGDSFAFHGQFRDFKGAHLLAQFLELCPSAKFSIFPNSADRQKIKEMGLTPSRYPNLKIETGYSWGKGLEDRLISSRGILLPSLWPTSTEYALIEGLAMGKPIIAFSVGAHKDYLVDGVNSMVSPTGDVKGFIDRLSVVNADAGLRAKLGRGARALYNQLWNPDIWKHHLEKAYKEMGYTMSSRGESRS